MYICILYRYNNNHNNRQQHNLYDYNNNLFDDENGANADNVDVFVLTKTKTNTFSLSEIREWTNALLHIYVYIVYVYYCTHISAWLSIAQIIAIYIRYEGGLCTKYIAII